MKTLQQKLIYPTQNPVVQTPMVQSPVFRDIEKISEASELNSEIMCSSSMSSSSDGIKNEQNKQSEVQFRKT